jgi:putative SOS response-associated peptidase YedK
MPARYNLAPTQDALVLRRNPETGERSLDPIRWGLIPHWAKDPAIGNKLINARAESIPAKPSFRDAFRRRRCLVPADGFYEWRKDTKPKQPYLIHMKDGEPFAFAGLWENWRDPATETWVRTFTIITTDANEVAAPIHNRMPAILAPGDYGRWLGEEPADEAALTQLLRPYPADLMEAFPVSLAVNRVTNDTPDLFAPLEATAAA